MARQCREYYHLFRYGIGDELVRGICMSAIRGSTNYKEIERNFLDIEFTENLIMRTDPSTRIPITLHRRTRSFVLFYSE